MSILRILQYNVWKSDDIMSALIGSQEATYDVIALQEPWKNKYVDTTYCPRSCPYHLVWPPGGGRTCLLVNKAIPLNCWTAKASADYCSIELRLYDELVTLHNYYSPSPPSQQTINWDTPLINIRQVVARPGHHIVVGDFNLHHYLWGGLHTKSIHAGSELLLQPIREGLLDLLTEPGLITWERQESKSTLDLTLCTPAISPRTRTGLAQFEYGSDHRPIETTVYLSGGIPTVPRRQGRCWKKTNYRQLSEEAQLIRPPGNLQTIQQVEQYTGYLVRTIQDLIDRTTPISRPSHRAQPWWSREVQQAVEEERAATQQCRHGGGPEAWRLRREASYKKKAVIARAKQAYWRTSIHEASQTPEGAWRIAKWARTQSYRPPEPPAMPPLRYSAGVARTTETKARALSERFYPMVEADLSDITDSTFADETFQNYKEIDSSVSSEDVAHVLQYCRPWKCPGQDGIPNGILKAMGSPLYQAVAELTTACWRLGTYPEQFKAARTVVLRKPDKDTYEEPGSWRPIALLNTIGKTMEALLARRLSNFAEKEGLLPDAQMGNRPGRSVDTALELLLEQIHTTWHAGGVATVLSLDISGAFDTVNHLRLLNELRIKGLPPWLVRWVQAFLTDRTTTLLIDGTETAPIQLTGGVPQGSPLSPILFTLYNSSLFRAAESLASGVSTLGFADDVNLLAYGRTTEANCQSLQAAHERCLNWATKYGMKFAPAKYTLIHFTRARTKYNVTAKVNLRGHEVSPSAEVRILGVQLDGKLRWGAHKSKLKKKLVTQMFALTRIAASTWGPNLLHARTIYTAAIRSALAHGASAWHRTEKTRSGKASGLAKELSKTQNQCLRVVTGAFRAVATRRLETEAYVPPLDLWLDSIVAGFQERLDNSPVGQLVRNSCAAIQRKLRQRGKRRSSPFPKTPGQERNNWAKEWKGTSRTTKDALRIHWRTRWQQQQEARLRNSTPANHGRIQSEPPPDPKVLKLHKTLRKAESSLLIQLRTECIGLKGFLFRRKVPGIESAQCECGDAIESPRHVLLHCNLEEDRRGELRRACNGPLRFQQLLGDPNLTATAVRWVMCTGRLGQFSLARRLLYG
jgi:hypothetical protein